MPRILPLFTSILFCSLGMGSVHADTLRCGQLLVTKDDSKYEVLKKCGEPDFSEVVSGTDQDKEEVWIYDFGPQRFQYVITFVGIRIFRIESEPSPPRMPVFGKSTMRCGQKLVKLGMNKLEVTKRCGEPQFSEVISGAHFVKREVWFYDFGSNRFIYHLTFKGVRLTDIDTEPQP